MNTCGARREGGQTNKWEAQHQQPFDLNYLSDVVDEAVLWQR